jgi:penicillin-binding protein 1C
MRRKARSLPRRGSCRFRFSVSERARFPTSASEPLRIVFPPNGSRLELVNPTGKPEPVAVKVQGGIEPLTVLVNGVPFRAAAGRRTLFFDPDGPGFVRLTVMDARGTADSVVVRVQ